MPRWVEVMDAFDVAMAEDCDAVSRSVTKRVKKTQQCMCEVGLLRQRVEDLTTRVNEMRDAYVLLETRASVFCGVSTPHVVTSAAVQKFVVSVDRLQSDVRRSLNGKVDA